MEDFSIASVFSDHMVLQRNKNICIFGWGHCSSDVEAVLKDSSNKILSRNVLSKAAAEEGKWKLYLPPIEAAENLTLEVKCGSFEKTFTDVAAGEVWLAGGQSNMEFELGNCTEGKEELENCKNSGVRFYYTQKIAWMDDDFYKNEKNTCWQKDDSEWKKAWSAVGYFYGKKLAAELGVTVGIIGCNWGGTSASAWMSRERLSRDEDLRTYLDEYAEATKGKSIEQQCREYDEYVKANDVWQEKCNRMYQENPDTEWAHVQEVLGPCLWPGPKSCKNPYRPTGLYECMLKRVQPYSMRGFIFYQGESDDHKPAMYYKLFREMIGQWRDDWNEWDMPFVFVQLPEHRYRQDKDFKNWCLIREAQLKIFQTVRNTGMAVAADLGQYNDIHPKAKKEVAERLAKQSLLMFYKKISASEAMGPVFKNMIAEGSSLKLTFAHSSEGFLIKNDEKELNEYREMEKLQGNEVDEKFNGFEIRGKDGVWQTADYKINSDNTISLFAEKIKAPVAARYGWYNYGPVTVFGKNQLPLSPFRTDSDADSENSEHAEIQQIMTV